MNMSYCRFENTLQDLEDCYDSDGMWNDEELNEYEKPARKRLIQLCKVIAAQFDYDDEDS